MAKKLVVRFKRVGPVKVSEPSRQSEAAAGYDLCAAVQAPQTLEPGERRLVPTGLAVALPPGHEGQVRPRSGLALHHGVTLLNAPGTVDEDYRGEIGVLLINLGSEDFVIEPDMRVAQLVISPVAETKIEMVEELDETDRGAGGYGSTGV
ncbi:MAG: dUTP diphosphatase [Deltaproteobacteria bacterium]|nr:dUTP diphosphatase [Deltaproteobacteria bacterium]